MLAFARSIAETVRHPLLVLDARDLVVAVNSAYYRAFHAIPADTVGRSFFELGDGLWNSPQLRSLLREIVGTDDVFEGLRIEKEIPTLGRRILVLTARRISRDEDGEPMVLLAIEDDTERHQAQETQKRLNTDLEGLVAERTNDLAAANKDLRHTIGELAAVNRELEAFCYSVSHDLRAPLRAIDGFSQELLQSHSGQLNDQGQHYLRRIRSGSQRMGQLIDDLLATFSGDPRRGE